MSQKKCDNCRVRIAVVSIETRKGVLLELCQPCYDVQVKG